MGTTFEEATKAPFTIETLRNRDGPDAWCVERTFDDGRCQVAVFAGFNAELRAKEYVNLLANQWSFELHSARGETLKCNGCKE